MTLRFYIGKKMKFIMVLACIALPLVAGAVQVISGSGSSALDSEGSQEGVSFINQSLNESTLLIPEGSNVNSKNNQAGIATDANGLGNITFTGTKDMNNVKGSVGTDANFMDNITIGSASVTFYSHVHANSLTFNGGVVKLQGTTTIGTGDITTSTFSILSLDKNVILNGNFVGSNGKVMLDNNATINGNVSAEIVEYHDQGTDLVQGATINGNVVTSNITIGAGILSINGNLAYNSQHNIVNLTENNAVAVPVNVSGTVTIGGDVSVDYHVAKFHAPREGAYNVVNAGGGGTSGAYVSIISNDVRFMYAGSNQNGNITITSTRRNSFADSPVAGTEQMFYSLLGVANANPNSDLDLIEGQLGFPTISGYQNALYQIAPNISLAGIGYETFNTTKKFLKVFLEHTHDNPCTCECYTLCNDRKLWMNGFGYHAKQANKNEYLGYQANTWGTVLAVEQPLASCLQAGLGLGYAYADVDLNRFGNTTKIHHYQSLAYFSYQPPSWYIDGGFGYSWNRYAGTRHINFQDIYRTAAAKYNGQEYTGFLASGYRLCHCGLEIDPLVTFLYSHLQLNAYHEHGADTLDLKIKKQHMNFAELGLGLKSRYTIESCVGDISPELHAFWMYNFITRAPVVRASYSDLAAAGGYFTSKGFGIDRHLWNIGGSLRYALPNDMMISLIYDYERSRTYWDHEWTVDLQYFF